MPRKKKEDCFLLKSFLQDPWVEESQTFGVTASLSYEVDTSNLIAHLWEMGKDVFLAKTEAKHQLKFVRYRYNSDLAKDAFGIDYVTGEAETNNKVDLMLVPGIAFSQQGHERLGFGGGYYDRFLVHFSGKTISLVNSAMSYQTPCWQLEPFDVPVQKLITVKN